MSGGMDPTGCECEQRLKIREDTKRKKKKRCWGKRWGQKVTHDMKLEETRVRVEMGWKETRGGWVGAGSPEAQVI